MNAVAHIEPEATFERVPPVGVKFHEHAGLFPWIEGAEFEELKADIAENGIREPIVFFDGQILDGRNRYMAARDLGIEYPRVEYQGDDPLGYVISLNLRRRHMSESQRGMVAAKLAKMPRGGDRKSDAFDQTANLRTDQAAAVMNVSPRTVEAARKVQEIGVPALVAAVETGVVSVSAAAEVAKLPVEEVQALVDKGPVAVKQAARDIREHRPAPRPVIDHKGRDPLDFNRAMHFRGMLRDYARELADCDFSDILHRLTEDERKEVRIVIGRIDAAHSAIIEGL